MDRLEQRRPYWREEDEQQEVEEYQDQHHSFAEKVERLLMQLIILGLVGLVLVQALQLNRFGQMLAREGISGSEVASWFRAVGEEKSQAAGGITTPMRVKVMSVTRRSVPEARLLLDGKVVGDFQSGSVAVEVRPGQVLVVDGTSYTAPLVFRVVEVQGVASPSPGTSITTQGDQQRLGVIRGSGK